MESEMSEQKTALEVILTQKDKGGLSDAAIILHQKQCKDAERMEKRMTEIEKKVDDLSDKVGSVESKVDELKALVIQKYSFVGSLKEILSNKVFLYILLITVASICGVSVAEVGTFLFK